MSDERGRAVRLLWDAPTKPSRGPKPALTLERITRTGIGVADGEGLAALSMQRVAGLLDVTKMALYRYMPGKAELVALMVDAALGETPPPPARPHSGWRPQLAAWARQLVTVFERHPWLLDAMPGPRVTGPRELAWTERALAALDGTGLTGAERLDAVMLLTGHVREIAQQARAAGAGAAGSAGDAQGTGGGERTAGAESTGDGPGHGPEEQFAAGLAGLMRDHGADFPALSAALSATATEGGRDQGLDFGLERILDGLGLLIAERAEHMERTEGTDHTD
ncbi:TetR/AcrR family transcriptional regulator [Streptomyces iconiensis]|uniref:TetR/AcrR family transcriptional regulator n=1 Tax=Streptomyces iconiensis TaxID=1384038 RepID=A0ABT7A6P7_9ACTN|nr:TetR/AcrR family transcriptional regulator [Streptomyces iconiensis]MDJ1136979.1 TetR/AcrR family transcriptional regulator [Streptomyces iconiensis]